jgi:hypothetical protein
VPRGRAVAVVEPEPLRGGALVVRGTNPQQGNAPRQGEETSRLRARFLPVPSLLGARCWHQWSSADLGQGGGV